MQLKCKKLIFILAACFVGYAMAKKGNKSFNKNKPYSSSYLTPQVISKIDPREVRLILEVGALHCLDSVMLFNYYKCPVIAFECSPLSILECKKTIKNCPAIKLVEMAVAEKEGTLTFNYCPTHPGSSSLSKFNYDSMAEINKKNNNLNSVEKLQAVYPMETVQVKATRLDTWLQANAIEQVDFLCIDAQGHTLPILKSLGNYLSKIKYIVAEVEYRSGYIGEALFPEIRDFMSKKGFVCFNDDPNPSAFFNDVLFVHKDFVK
jgi:FkbM family methyltransferase